MPCPFCLRETVPEKSKAETLKGKRTGHPLKPKEGLEWATRELSAPHISVTVMQSALVPHICQQRAYVGHVWILLSPRSGMETYAELE